MREIKFRAFYKPKKIMCDVVQVDFGADNYYLVNSKNQREYFLCTYDKIELMQFTGLCDKHGNKIYEGDVLNMRNRYLKKDNQVFKNTGEVYFEKGVFRCDQIPLAYLDELEIIGNIYDNSKISEE